MRYMAKQKGFKDMMGYMESLLMREAVLQKKGDLVQAARLLNMQDHYIGRRMEALRSKAKSKYNTGYKLSIREVRHLNLLFAMLGVKDIYELSRRARRENKTPRQFIRDRTFERVLRAGQLSYAEINVLYDRGPDWTEYMKVKLDLDDARYQQERNHRQMITREEHASRPRQEGNCFIRALQKLAIDVFPLKTLLMKPDHGLFDGYHVISAIPLIKALQRSYSLKDLDKMYRDVFVVHQASYRMEPEGRRDIWHAITRREWLQLPIDQKQEYMTFGEYIHLAPLEYAWLGADLNQQVVKRVSETMVSVKTPADLTLVFSPKRGKGPVSIISDRRGRITEIYKRKGRPIAFYHVQDFESGEDIGVLAGRTLNEFRPEDIQALSRNRMVIIQGLPVNRVARQPFGFVALGDQKYYIADDRSQADVVVKDGIPLYILGDRNIPMQLIDEEGMTYHATKSRLQSSYLKPLGVVTNIATNEDGYGFFLEHLKLADSAAVVSVVYQLNQAQQPVLLRTDEWTQALTENPYAITVQADGTTSVSLIEPFKSQPHIFKVLYGQDLRVLRSVKGNIPSQWLDAFTGFVTGLRVLPKGRMRFAGRDLYLPEVLAGQDVRVKVDAAKATMTAFVYAGGSVVGYRVFNWAGQPLDEFVTAQGGRSLTQLAAQEQQSQAAKGLKRRLRARNISQQRRQLLRLINNIPPKQLEYMIDRMLEEDVLNKKEARILRYAVRNGVVHSRQLDAPMARQLNMRVQDVRRLLLGSKDNKRRGINGSFKAFVQKTGKTDFRSAVYERAQARIGPHLMRILRPGIDESLLDILHLLSLEWVPTSPADERRKDILMDFLNDPEQSLDSVSRYFAISYDTLHQEDQRIGKRLWGLAVRLRLNERLLQAVLRNPRVLLNLLAGHIKDMRQDIDRFIQREAAKSSALKGLSSADIQSLLESRLYQGATYASLAEEYGYARSTIYTFFEGTGKTATVGIIQRVRRRLQERMTAVLFEEAENINGQKNTTYADLRRKVAQLEAQLDFTFESVRKHIDYLESKNGTFTSGPRGWYCESCDQPAQEKKAGVYSDGLKFLQHIINNFSADELLQEVAVMRRRGVLSEEEAFVLKVIFINRNPVIRIKGISPSRKAEILHGLKHPRKLGLYQMLYRSISQAKDQELLSHIQDAFINLLPDQVSGWCTG